MMKNPWIHFDLGIDLLPDFKEEKHPERITFRAANDFFLKNPGKDLTTRIEASLSNDRTVTMKSSLDSIEFAPDGFESVYPGHSIWDTKIKKMKIPAYVARHVAIDNYIDNDKSISIGNSWSFLDKIYAKERGDEMFDFLMDFIDVKRVEDVLSTRGFDVDEPIEVERKLVDKVIKEHKKKNQAPRIAGDVKKLAKHIFLNLPEVPRYDTTIDNKMAKERYRLFGIRDEQAIKDMIDITINFNFGNRFSMLGGLSKHPSNVVKNAVIDFIKDDKSWIGFSGAMDIDYCIILLDMASRHSESKSQSLRKISDDAMHALYGKGMKKEPKCVTRIIGLLDTNPDLKRKWNKL